MDDGPIETPVDSPKAKHRMVANAEASEPGSSTPTQILGETMWDELFKHQN